MEELIAIANGELAGPLGEDGPIGVRAPSPGGLELFDRSSGRVIARVASGTFEAALERRVVGDLLRDLISANRLGFAFGEETGRHRTQEGVRRAIGL